MNSDQHFDVDAVIVGGGPAGVSCAIAIARAGYSVTIVDKKSRNLIGDKTCGDAIDRAALVRVHERIGIGFPEGDALSDTITKMSIAAEHIDTKITLDAPGYLVDRLHFGQYLLGIAEQNGVTIIDRAPVRGLIIEEIEGEPYISGIHYFKNGTVHTIRAKFTVDASGAYAVVRKLLPDQMIQSGMKKELDASELWPTYREIIELAPEHQNHPWQEEIILLYRDEFPPPAYFWIFSKGKGRLNVGIGWEKTQQLGKMKEWFQKEMSRYYLPHEYRVLKKGGGQIPFRIPFDNLVFNGGALAGDAACMVHPLTAEGHGPALDTGSSLGTVIVNALEEGGRDMTSLWEYNVIVSSHYARKHVEAYLVKEFLREVGATGLEYLIKRKIFREEELNLIFSGGALNLSLIEKLKRVLLLVFKPKLMFSLKRTLDLSDKTKRIYAAYPRTPEGIEAWREMRNRELGLRF